MLEPAALLPTLLALCVKLMGGILAIYAFLAVGDGVYQRLVLAEAPAHVEA